LNSNATTVNAFGAATTLEIGAATGTTNINNNLDVDGDVNIDGGDLTVSTTTFNIANSTNSTTTIAIGGNSTTTTMQNLTLNGNLSVLGNTTTVTTQNLTVADRFILLGSSSLNQNIDGGIVVQNRFAVNSGKATGSGYALFMDGANVTNASSPRWAVTSSLSELADEATPDEYLVTAKQSSVAPTLPPTYGSASAGYGNMYINSSDESIWIYV
jgi:hypothetical protein